MKEMRLSERVEGQREEIKPPSLISWIGATTAGYALGMTLSSYFVGSALRPLGPVLLGMLNVLIYGAIIGIFVGVFQFVVIPRGRVPFLWWTLAALSCAAIGFAVAAVVAEALGNLMAPIKNMVLVQGIIVAVAGMIIGSATGLGQWLVLQRHLSRMRGWIIASTLGTMLGTVTAAVLLGLFELPLINALPSTAVGAIMGILVGASQGLVLRSNWR